MRHNSIFKVMKDPLLKKGGAFCARVHCVILGDGNFAFFT